MIIVVLKQYNETKYRLDSNMQCTENKMKK